MRSSGPLTPLADDDHVELELVCDGVGGVISPLLSNIYLGFLWNAFYFQALGLHKLMGTVRYPEAA